jgi:glycosyltransferase involved in cell wall biosynthesis
MTLPARLFMDVSYTRTQHVSTGIVRTVRRLEEELRRLCEGEGTKFALVSYHSGGFRELAGGVLPSPACPHAAGVRDRPAARLFRWIAGPFFRRMVLAALRLPWPLLRPVWSITSSWAFNFLGRADRSAPFGPGDVLLMCDASWNYPAWVAARKARDRGVKLVLVAYDLMPLQHPGFCFPLVPHIFRLWLDRMLPIADFVVCISQATEQDLRLYARETGTPLPPTGHFRLGSDPVRSPSASGRVRDELTSFVRGGPTFAAIGSFEPKKNYGFLLDVFERLWQRGEPARLLIIGRESAECEALIARVRHHVEQGQHLLTLFDANDAEVDFVYSTCRALVFPSLAEGFGLPLVEARTRGSLVIASDLPCFAELADEGVAMYPGASGDALARLVTAYARALPPGDIPPMRPFTWAESARQLLEVVHGADS